MSFSVSSIPKSDLTLSSPSKFPTERKDWKPSSYGRVQFTSLEAKSKPQSSRINSFFQVANPQIRRIVVSPCFGQSPSGKGAFFMLVLWLTGIICVCLRALREWGFWWCQRGGERSSLYVLVINLLLTLKWLIIQNFIWLNCIVCSL